MKRTLETRCRQFAFNYPEQRHDNDNLAPLVEMLAARSLCVYMTYATPKG